MKETLQASRLDTKPPHLAQHLQHAAEYIAKRPSQPATSRPQAVCIPAGPRDDYPEEVLVCLHVRLSFCS